VPSLVPRVLKRLPKAKLVKKEAATSSLRKAKRRPRPNQKSHRSGKNVRYDDTPILGRFVRKSYRGTYWLIRLVRS
jgi:hypothetical protein